MEIGAEVNIRCRSPKVPNLFRAEVTRAEHRLPHQIWLESIRWTFLNVTYSMYLVADVIFIYLTMVSTATSRFEKASSELHGCSRLLGNERGGNASKSRIFTNFYGVEPPLLLNFNFGDTLNKFHLQTLVSLDQKKIERRKTAGHFVKLPDILGLNYAKTEFFKLPNI